MLLPRLFTALFCAVCASVATAHEFWIEAERWQVAPGTPIVARLRNGETLVGTELAWFDRNFSRFDLVQGDAVLPVTGRLGDRPAMTMAAPGEGLVIIAHETTPSTVTYKTWEKFANFAAHKDFPDIRARHEAAGFPTEKFKELYTRHAKALIGVGHGEGADRALGLATEFVALTNPYAPGFDGLMRVRLDYQGAPRADAQVEVFDQAPDGTVTVTLTRTDAAGLAEVPVTSGHNYLFDGVVLRKAPTDSGSVWETLWAALTFAVP